MAIHSELFAETRPVSDMRVRSEAYRIWYTVMRQLDEPGLILSLPAEQWMSLADPLCDWSKLESEAECENLKAFLKAMPEMIRNGGMTVNFKKKPNGMVKYSADEWGTVTRHHNPKVNITDPDAPQKPYRSPVKLEWDEPEEDWQAEYWAEFEASIMAGNMSEADVKDLLHKERKVARAAKKMRHSMALPIRHASAAENGPQDIHKRFTPKPEPKVLPVGTLVKPVRMLALPGGASVDTYDWGEITYATVHEYRVTFAEHSRIDIETLETVRGGNVTANVEITDVTEV